jgi:iron complex transport system substrate-binding protein
VRAAPRSLALPALLALAAWLAAALLGCQQPEARPAGARAASGEPQRIVSLSPATTEILFAMGAGARVVGVSRYCDYPPEVLKLPRVGGFLDPNLEAIVALRPDLVVGSTNGAVRPLMEHLQRLGVRVDFPSVDSVGDVLSAVRQLGRAAGVAAAGEALATRLEAKMAEVKRRVQGQSLPRVVVVHGQRPLVVAGQGTYADEVVRMAGGTNVGAEGQVKYPSFDMERLLELRPDVIVDASMDQTPLAPHLARLSGVPAVAEGRISRPAGGLLLRPGPRLIEVLDLFVELLHPREAR